MAEEVWVLIFGVAPLCGLLTLTLAELSDRSVTPGNVSAVDGVVYGGWWAVDWLGRRVVCRAKCQAPRWDLYRANLTYRCGHGF